MPRSTKCTWSQDMHPGTLPGTSPFPRTPPPAPRTQLPRGDCLLSGSRTGKPSLALRGNGCGPHSNSTAHPSGILAPALGSSSRQQEGTDWHTFPRSSACRSPGLPSKSQTGASMPGAKASKLPRGGAARQLQLGASLAPLPQAPSSCAYLTQFTESCPCGVTTRKQWEAGVESMSHTPHKRDGCH